MFLEKSKDKMMKAFEKVKYTYQEIPERVIKSSFGIYVNFPFCKTKCKFCPFYKELYRREDVQRYVPLLVKEIMDSNITGSPNWIYFGGGTPNLLSISQLARIMDALKSKVSLDEVGIEIHPAQIDDAYLKGLAQLGFTKISVGVESLTSEIHTLSGRTVASSGEIFHLIHLAQKHGLFVNADMMLGLAGQSENIILEDIKLLSKSGTNQITLYPYLVFNGMQLEATMADEHQFHVIEKAATHLSDAGYVRRSTWDFTVTMEELYDSSRDEMVDEYIGFGAGSFSSYGKWRVVNPTYQKYAHNLLQGNKMGLVAPKTKSSDDWRKFARMISDLELHTSADFPAYINMYIVLMQLNGYGHHGKLTEKGIRFAHRLTKTAIESLPFPLQNPAKITNYQSYISEVMKDEPV